MEHVKRRLVAGLITLAALTSYPTETSSTNPSIYQNKPQQRIVQQASDQRNNDLDQLLGNYLSLYKKLQEKPKQRNVTEQTMYRRIEQIPYRFLSSAEPMEVELTAYNEYNPGVDKTTAIGAEVTWGRTIAIDSQKIKLRSCVYIPALHYGTKEFWPFIEQIKMYPELKQFLLENPTDGIFRAEDTGGLVDGNEIDIYLGNDNISRELKLEMADQFGRRREVKAFVLDTNYNYICRPQIKTAKQKGKSSSGK